jgi:hypothetical protein
LAAKMKDFGKKKFCVFTKVCCQDSPSAGEFIRCKAQDS